LPLTKQEIPAYRQEAKQVYEQSLPRCPSVVSFALPASSGLLRDLFGGDSGGGGGRGGAGSGDGGNGDGKGKRGAAAGILGVANDPGQAMTVPQLRELHSLQLQLEQEGRENEQQLPKLAVLVTEKVSKEVFTRTGLKRGDVLTKVAFFLLTFSEKIALFYFKSGSNLQFIFN
jgi:hypothetical protein